jgi:hypothetical protein
MSAIPKQTRVAALHESAFDPQQTSRKLTTNAGQFEKGESGHYTTAS